MWVVDMDFLVVFEILEVFGKWFEYLVFGYGVVCEELCE